MVLLGVNPHKDTHTFVAVDQAGRQLGQLTVAARTLGHAELLGWARHCWPDERRWAVEDCRHVTGRLERDLLAWLAGAPSSVQVAGCQELTVAIGALTARIDQLTGELGQRVARLAPNLLSLPGCGPLTAAKLIAEPAGVARFRSEACFAMHAGSRRSR
jgi:Transposase IS116/IS110/IS902 family